jgi:hypothetical protein
MNPNEAVRRDAAFQERPEFPLNKFRDWAFAILPSCQKCFQMLGDHPVENRFFGLTWDVFERGALHAPRALCRLLADTSRNVSNQLQLRRSRSPTFQRQSDRLFQRFGDFPNFLVSIGKPAGFAISSHWTNCT